MLSPPPQACRWALPSARPASARAGAGAREAAAQDPARRRVGRHACGWEGRGQAPPGPCPPPHPARRPLHVSAPNAGARRPGPPPALWGREGGRTEWTQVSSFSPARLAPAPRVTTDVFAASVSLCQLVTHSHSALGDRKFPRGPQALTQQEETVTVLAKGQNVPEREEAEELAGRAAPLPTQKQQPGTGCVFTAG